MCHRRSLAQHYVRIYWLLLWFLGKNWTFSLQVVLWGRKTLWSSRLEILFLEFNVSGGTCYVDGAKNLRFNLDLRLLCLLHLSLLLPDAQSLRCCHHGQLWLFDQRFLHFRGTPSRWIYQDLGWIRSQCYVGSKIRYFNCLKTTRKCRSTLLILVFYASFWVPLKLVTLFDRKFAKINHFLTFLINFCPLKM